VVAAVTFDRLARVYQPIEYLVFDRWLQRCRAAFVPQLADCRRVLILGEGDGRFLAAFLKANTVATVDVLDVSSSMAQLAQRRIAALPGAAGRVRFTVADARTAELPGAAYDAIVTNFFLDCFAADQLDALIGRLVQALAPGGRWVVGDFRLPPAGAPRRRAAVKLAAMYGFFRLAAHLPAGRLVDPTPLLRRHGLELCAEKLWQGGFLSAQMWKCNESPRTAVRGPSGA
jgi:ubiquinone/menaquinone biosynthesis C-methylase UbiE